MKPQILASLFSSAWAFLCLLCTRGSHRRRRVRRKRYLYIPLLLVLIALALAAACLSGD